MMYKKLMQGFMALFTDKNFEGDRELSIGRLPLLVVLGTMCYWYIKTGSGPDTGVLAYIGMAMAYNGFSKTPWSKK